MFYVICGCYKTKRQLQYISRIPDFYITRLVLFGTDTHICGVSYATREAIHACWLWSWLAGRLEWIEICRARKMRWDQFLVNYGKRSFSRPRASVTVISTLTYYQLGQLSKYMNEIQRNGIPCDLTLYFLSLMFEGFHYLSEDRFINCSQCFKVAIC